MSYLTQHHITESAPMRSRVAQCAAGEGVIDADSWAEQHKRRWAAAPGWDAAWESFLVSNPGHDPGVEEVVITDGQILAQVQSLLG